MTGVFLLLACAPVAKGRLHRSAAAGSSASKACRLLLLVKATKRFLWRTPLIVMLFAMTGCPPTSSSRAMVNSLPKFATLTDVGVSVGSLGFQPVLALS